MTELLSRIHRCQFCGKTFARKPWFIRHICAKKRKFEETNDIIVQHAYRVYSYWMHAERLMKKSKEPAFDKFLKSPFKKSFIRLIMFTREHGIMSPYTFIDWIVAKRIPERDWCDAKSTTLEEYKEYLNIYEDPEEQALATLAEIEKWILDDPDKRTPELFFSKLGPGTILTLVRQRVIMPWVLFAYDPIASKWLDDAAYDADTFYRIDDLVSCTYWAEKMEQEPEGANIVKQVMDQLWQYQT